MLYPLKLKPVYKSKPWGGTALHTYFGKNIPKGRIGESWELCCRDDGMSIVQNGKFQGKTIRQLISAFHEKILGTRVCEIYRDYFPLFFKILDASDRLSVQVHPDDVCAAANGLKQGKDEMWYVIEAQKDSGLIYGLNDGTSKEDLTQAIHQKRVSELLRRVPVKSGDFFAIPGGTVHAILGGILVAEIQQNCNTTYRIYDWDRSDKSGKRRQLHIPQALEAIHFGQKIPDALRNPFVRESGALIRKGPRIKEFEVDEIRLDGLLNGQTTPESFQVIMDLKGHGEIAFDGGFIHLYKGDTVLIPARMGKYRLLGDMLALLTYMPPAA